MGNQIVIPSPTNWYTQILSTNGYKITEQIECGDLFLKFDSRRRKTHDREEKKFIYFIKAYQNYEPLTKLPGYDDYRKYFDRINGISSNSGIVNYTTILETQNEVFFIRKKLGRTLSEVATFQEPPLYPEEKLWITFQISHAIRALHALKLAHGDLKPSNILVMPSDQIHIVDPAPFKPATLDPQKPHLFYYFFANGKSSGYFLAPERISSEISEGKEINLMLADLFSLGCVIAFLYLNGDFLFNLDTISKYIKGEFDVDPILAPINDRNIIRFIKGLISLNPSRRLEIFNQFMEKVPSKFIQMRKLFFRASYEEPSVDFPKVASILQKNNIGMKVAFFNYFADRALKLTNLCDLLYSIDFMIDYTRSLDDEAKVTRVIPLLLQLGEIRISSVRHTILFGLLDVFRNIKVVPADYKTIFVNSIKPRLQAQLIGRDSTESDAIAAAEFLPYFAWEVNRLHPDSLQTILMAFGNIFANKKLTIFRAFARPIREVAKKANFEFFSAFFVFFMSSINSLPPFKIEVIKILIEFYKYAKEEEKIYYVEQFYIFLTGIFDIIDRDRERDPEKEDKDQEELICVILEFFILVMDRNFLPRTFTYALAEKTMPYLYHKKAKIRTLMTRTLRYFTPLAQQGPLLHFAFDRVKITPESRPAIQKKRPNARIGSPLKLVDSVNSPNFDPRFLKTSRIANEPVTSISLDNDFCVYVSDNKTVRWLSICGQMLPVRTITSKDYSNSPIIDISSIDAQVVVSCKNGLVDAIDNHHAKTTRMREKFTNNDFSTCLCPLRLSNCILTGQDKGIVQRIDLRSPDTQIIMPFNLNGLVSLSTIPGKEIVCCAGFSCGIVATIDLRMNLPLAMTLTIPAYQVWQVYSPNNDTAYAVCDGTTIQVVEEPTNNVAACIYGHKFVGASHNGGVVLVDDNSVSYVDFFTKQNSLKLYDGSKISLSLSNTDINESLSSDELSGRSLHSHSVPVTCIDHIGDLFVSGDISGFVNIWSTGNFDPKIFQ
ncbi:hypothetical protein TRFO_39795 [Tritrichomonas foetus]|uniref:Protein kinase domain-containing protein n=1 Tax=Tritrichomonas foetus TaxID=1144522 RepID=A0A1J4J9D1_9EUKA|nr:hypothetical protein TRFO_39795 [Tritrichomonas foetus]|eukprot:OHS94029.1 hypothetical protein TRFO_39795 [Tritrichomonas foetus]